MNETTLPCPIQCSLFLHCISSYVFLLPGTQWAAVGTHVPSEQRWNAGLHGVGSQRVTGTAGVPA